MDKFIGSWKLDKSENFDEFMKKKGAPWMARKLMATAKPTKTYTKNDDGSFTAKTEAPMKTIEWKFKLGEQFEGDGMDGKKHKITFTINSDGDLIEEHEVIGEPAKNDSNLTKVEGDHIVTHLECEGVTAKRYFKKL